MKIGVQELSQFNHLASIGAARSAKSLSELTGLDMHVEITDVSLVTDAVLNETFSGEPFVGVEVGLHGGLDGEAVLAFEESDAVELQSLLMGTDDVSERLARSGVTELGNIMIGGFIDGWANKLGIGIDLTPPRYVEARGSRILPDSAIEAAKEHGVFLFESKLTAPDTDLEFSLYMMPDYTQFLQLLQGGNSEHKLPVNKLSAFGSMAKQGSENAADQISMMTGLDTTVDVSRLRFIPLKNIPAHVGDEMGVGIVFELTGTPSGYLVFLFDEASAKKVAGSMLPTGPEDEIGDMTVGALEELGNIITSGFIDGWANVLQTSIEHSPPQLIHDMNDAIMSPVITDLGRKQDNAFVIDSTINLDGTEEQCDIYALPEERKLSEALRQLPDT